MPVLNIRKETAVPGTFGANEAIFVSRAGDPSLMDLYLSNAAGDALRRTINTEDVQSLIDTALAGATGEGVMYAADITARDAIADPANGAEVYVADASADATVATGWAKYIWFDSVGSWTKIAEGESQDLALSWTAITGRPTSTSAQIDAAVGASHSHSNITELNQIGQDGDGNLTYNGSLPRAAVTTAAW